MVNRISLEILLIKGLTNRYYTTIYSIPVLLKKKNNLQSQNYIYNSQSLVVVFMRQPILHVLCLKSNIDYIRLCETIFEIVHSFLNTYKK